MKSALSNSITKSTQLRRTINSYVHQKTLIFLFIPVIAYYIIFCYTPMYGLIISFKDFRILDGILASPWAGLKYFKFAFASQEFWTAFRNTLIISAMKLVVNFPAPIVFALLLNEVRNLHFKKVVQTVSYLPHFLSWVVLSGIVINFLSPSTGPVNMLLIALGQKPIYFVANLGWFRPVLVGSTMWKELGFASIVYLAAITGINPELFEAARLDGASRFKQVMNVILPSISPIIVVMFIFAIGGIVNDDFDQIFNLYNPIVYSVGDVLSTYIYRIGLENMQYSYSAAVGLFKNVIAFGLIIITNTMARKYSDYGLW